MSRRDFSILAVVCLIWGSNFVVTKLLLGSPGDADAMPPLFLAALRFTGVALVLLPLLWPIPRRLGLVTAYGLAVGAGHFAFLYMGLQLTSPSTAAIVFPMYLPMTAVMSFMFLGEQITRTRIIGIGVAAVGVVLVGLKPGGLVLSAGVILILGACLAGAASAVLNRALKDDLKPMQSQAWTGLVSLAPLWVLTFMFETGQGQALAMRGPLFYLFLAHVILIVGIVGHSAFFYVMSRNDATLVTPLTLMAPLWGVFFGLTLLGDPLTWQLAVGGALVLAGVIPIALETPKSMARAIAAEAAAR